MKKFFYEYKYLFVITSVLILCIFSVIFINDLPFALNPDQAVQYDIYYREWIRLITEFFKGGGLPFYSWNTFLGTDFLATQAYPITGDVFLPLLLLFKDHVTLGLFIEVLLCIYISVFTMNGFLKEYGVKSQLSRNFIALIYGFSGWAFLFYGTYMFHRFYAFLPILLWGVEFFINRKKSWLFIIGVALLFLQTYYLMFPTSIFLAIYCSFTLCIRNYRLVEIFKSAIVMIGLYFVGFFISAIITLPGILALLSNPRVGNAGEFSLFWNLNTYIGIVTTMFTSPFPLFTGYGNLFQGVSQHEWWYSMYIGIIAASSSIRFLFSKINRKYLIAFITLMLIVCIKPLSSIVHGFSDPSMRLSLYPMIFLLICSAKALDSNQNFIKTGYIICSISTLGTLFLLMQYGENYIIHFISIVFYTLCALIIIFVFNKNRKIAMALIIIQIGVMGYHTLYEFTKNHYKFGETIQKDEVKYYTEQNPDKAYRYYVDHKHLLPSSEMNTNKPMDYGFMGVSTYNSVYDTNILPFLNIEKPVTWHIFDLNNPKLMPMLGVRYYIVYDESELPSELNFTFSHNLGHLKVYEVEEFKGFGYTASQLDYFNNINDVGEFTNTVFVDDTTINIKEYENIKGNEFIVTERRNNLFKGYINSESENILFIPIPNNPGWRIFNNGTEVDSISVNGGFLGIHINEGENIIEMNFISPGFKTGLALSLLGIIMFAILCVLEIIYKKPCYKFIKR